jgi:putative transposase
MNPPLRDPGRRSLPHLAPMEHGNQAVIQYVTTNVDKRRPLLANQETVDVLLAAWRKGNHWLVGRYVIMPDHIHLFCAPVVLTTPLKRWMEFWHAEATRHWPRPDEKPIWQRDFFDRQLRNGESYAEKWTYVWENPVRTGLVSRAEDWPWKGELNTLQWHEP